MSRSSTDFVTIMFFKLTVLLHGGEDGFDVVRAVSATARRLLRPGGVLVIEHGEFQ